MHKAGHYGAVLLVYAPFGAVLLAAGADRVALTAGVVAVAGAMLPDYDLRVPGLSHRGITHTVWFAGLVTIVAGALGALIAGAAIGVGAALGGAVAVGSHVAADALTPAGVEPFAPLDTTHYTVVAVRAANPLANYTLFGLGVAAAVICLSVGSTLAG